MPNSAASKEEILVKKLSSCLNFNCTQKGCSFIDAIGALSVVTACLIQENARGNQKAVTEQFKTSLDGLMEAMANDEAVPLN